MARKWRFRAGAKTCFWRKWQGIKSGSRFQVSGSRFHVSGCVDVQSWNIPPDKQPSAYQITKDYQSGENCTIKVKITIAKHQLLRFVIVEDIIMSGKFYIFPELAEEK
jgi:hypothetical protein